MAQSIAADEALERLLEPSFIADLAELPTSEVRERRDEAVSAETRVSYARRILQGRIDLLRGEVTRRSSPTTTSVLELLPRMLGETGKDFDPTSVRLPRMLAPPDAGTIDVDVEDAVSLTELSDDGVAELARGYADHEARLSQLRLQLFDVIDTLQAEVVERYRTGATSVTEVLQPDPGIS